MPTAAQPFELLSKPRLLRQQACHVRFGNAEPLMSLVRGQARLQNADLLQKRGDPLLERRDALPIQLMPIRRLDPRSDLGSQSVVQVADCPTPFERLEELGELGAFGLDNSLGRDEAAGLRIEALLEVVPLFENGLNASLRSRMRRLGRTIGSRLLFFLPFFPRRYGASRAGQLSVAHRQLGLKRLHIVPGATELVCKRCRLQLGRLDGLLGARAGPELGLERAIVSD